MASASVTNDGLAALNWGQQGTFTPAAGSTGYEAIVQRLEEAGLPSGDLQLVAAVMAQNGITREQLANPVPSDFNPQIPEPATFRSQWNAVVRSNDFDTFVADVDISHVYEVRTALRAGRPMPTQPLAIAEPRAQGPAVQGPMAPAAQGPIAQVPVAQSPTVPAPETPEEGAALNTGLPQVVVQSPMVTTDLGPTAPTPVAPGTGGSHPAADPDREARVREAAVDANARLNAGDWAREIQRELASEEPDQQLILTRIQQLMRFGSSDTEPNFPGLDVYNETFDAEPGTPGDLSSYVLIRELEAQFSGDVFLEVAMAYIRNESAQFEAEDYIYFGAVRGFDDSFFAGWGAAEYTVDDIYRSLRNPQAEEDVPPEENIHRVNLRYHMKYGPGDDSEYNATLPLLSELELRRFTSPDPSNPDNPYPIGETPPPLAVIAEEEFYGTGTWLMDYVPFTGFTGEQARTLQVMPYAAKNADGSVQPAYRVAMQIAYGNETAVLDAVEQIRPAGSETPLAWDQVQHALEVLSGTGLFANDDGPITGRSYPSGRRREDGQNIISLNALIESRLSGRELTTYRDYLSQDGGRPGRFGLSDEDMAIYVARRIYDETLGMMGDDEDEALARYDRYIVGDDVPREPGDGRVPYSMVLAAGVEHDDVDRELHSRLADGTDGDIATRFALLNGGEDPRSPTMRYGRITELGTSFEDRDTLRAMLTGLEEADILGIIDVAVSATDEDAERRQLEALLNEIGAIEGGTALNSGEADLIPSPSVARFLLAMTNMGGPAEEIVARYHRDTFLWNGDEPVAVNPAVDIAAAFHRGETAQRLEALARGIPFHTRVDVADGFAAFQETLGTPRTLVEAFESRLGRNTFRRINAHIQPLREPDPNASIEENMEVFREALHANVGWLARTFTDEHSVLEVRMRDLEVRLEELIREAQVRRQHDPSHPGFLPEDLVAFNQVVQDAMRASFNTERENAEFEAQVVQTSVFLAALASGILTAGLSTSAMLATTTINVGRTALTVPVVTAHGLRAMATGAAATAGTGVAVDFAIDGELDLEARDHLFHATLGAGGVLMMAPYPGMAAATSWQGVLRSSAYYVPTGAVGGGAINVADAWRHERAGFGELGYAFAQGAGFGSVFAFGGAALFNSGALAFARMRGRVGSRPGTPDAPEPTPGTPDALEPTPGTGGQGPAPTPVTPRPGTPSGGQPTAPQRIFQQQAQERWDDVALAANQHSRRLLQSSSAEALEEADNALLTAMRRGADDGPIPRKRQGIREVEFRPEFAAAIQRMAPGDSTQNLVAALRELVQVRTLGLRQPSPRMYIELRRMVERLYGETPPLGRGELQRWISNRASDAAPAVRRQLVDMNAFEALEFVIARELRTRQVASAQSIAAMGPEQFQGVTQDSMRDALTETAEAFGVRGPAQGQIGAWLDEQDIVAAVGGQALSTEQRVLIALESVGGPESRGLALQRMGAVVDDAAPVTTPVRDDVAPPRPVDEPTPAPVEEPAPPRPVEEPTPAPVEEPAPPRPVEEPTPAPVDEPAPPRPVEEPTPAPVEEPAPPRPVDEPTPAPVEEPAPITAPVRDDVPRPVIDDLPPVEAPAPFTAPARPVQLVDDIRPGAARLDAFPDEAVAVANGTTSVREAVQGMRAMRDGLNPSRLTRLRNARAGLRPESGRVTSEINMLTRAQQRLRADRAALVNAAGDMQGALAAEIDATLNAIESRISQQTAMLARRMPRELDDLARWNGLHPRGARRLLFFGRSRNQDLVTFGRAFDITDEIANATALREAMRQQAARLRTTVDDVAIRELNGSINAALESLEARVPDLVAIARRADSQGHQANLAAVRRSLNGLIEQGGDQAGLARQVRDLLDSQMTIPDSVGLSRLGGADFFEGNQLTAALRAAQGDGPGVVNPTVLREQLAPLVDNGGPVGSRAREILGWLDDATPNGVAPGVNLLDEVDAMVSNALQAQGTRMEQLTNLMEGARNGTASMDQAMRRLIDMFEQIETSRRGQNRLWLGRVGNDDRANLSRTISRFYRELREFEAVASPYVQSLRASPDQSPTAFLQSQEPFDILSRVAQNNRGLGDNFIAAINQRRAQMRAAMPPGEPVPQHLQPIRRLSRPTVRRVVGAAIAIPMADAVLYPIDAGIEAVAGENESFWTLLAETDNSPADQGLFESTIAPMLPSHFGLVEGFTNWAFEGAVENFERTVAEFFAQR